MRRHTQLPLLWLLAGALGGCPADLLPPDTLFSEDPAGFPTGSDGAETSAAPVPTAAQLAGDEHLTLSGSVIGSGNYQLFDLGPAQPGDEWQVMLTPLLGEPNRFTVALFDADYDLLMRSLVSTSTALRHVTRAETPHVYLGVTPRSGNAGGDFRFDVLLTSGADVPPPRRQLVYLNFGPGVNVEVHGRRPIDFAPFDASMLGEDFRGRTAEMKERIVEIMEADYAPYNVILLTSDDGPPPHDEPYTTVHFGGYDTTLLGLADNVDMYNADPQQAAIIYVESFAQYTAMLLDAEQMAYMVGNVASHELGHLLGLYHTKDPDELMDTTGTAWDLTEDQAFRRGPLEDSVFPIGMENTPRLLEQTVGLADKSAEVSAKPVSPDKMLLRARIRAFARSEMTCRCGNCLNPD